MQMFNVVVLFVTMTLVGVEFSVTAFVNPSAWRLEDEAQGALLADMAKVLGRVMPVWYIGSTVLLGVEAWLYRRTAEGGLVLAAAVVWLLVALGSIVWLVPLNTAVAERVAGWQEMHRTWDQRHRVRVAALVVAAGLLAWAVVR